MAAQRAEGRRRIVECWQSLCTAWVNCNLGDTDIYHLVKDAFELQIRVSKYVQKRLYLRCAYLQITVVDLQHNKATLRDIFLCIDGYEFISCA